MTGIYEWRCVVKAKRNSGNEIKAYGMDTNCIEQFSS